MIPTLLSVVESSHCVPLREQRAEVKKEDKQEKRRQKALCKVSLLCKGRKESRVPRTRAMRESVESPRESRDESPFESRERRWSEKGKSSKRRGIGVSESLCCES